MSWWPVDNEDASATRLEPPQIQARDGIRDVALRWGGILGVYFSAQTVTQLAGIVAGLLLINFMPIHEYALYTLAMSVVAFFTFLTDLGATSSLLYFSRESKGAGEPLKPFVAALLSLRLAACAAGAVAVLVGFPFVASRKGFNSTAALLAAGAIVLTAVFQITGSVRVLVLRLTDRYGPAYRAEMASGLARLVVVGGMIASSLLFAWVGVLGNALAAGALAFIAGSALATPTLSTGLAPYRRKIVRYLLPTLPSGLYFSIQGPLVVWLATTFGGTRNIAEVGALGRLGMIVGLFSGLSSVVFLPHLSAITDDRLYLRRCLQFGGVLSAIGATLYGAATLVPEPILLVLGKSYSGLNSELRLIVLTAGLTLLGGFAGGVNMARSWTRMQGVTVVAYAVLQVAAILLVDLRTTAGILTFGVLSQLGSLGLQLVVCVLGFMGCRAVVWARL